MYSPGLLLQRTSASPKEALLLFVTSSITPATCDGLHLVACSTREASNLGVTRNWHLHHHGHHSGARLDIRGTLYWEVLHHNHLPIEAKIDFKGLIGHLKRDLVHENLMEDLIGRPQVKVDTLKV